MTDIVDRLRRWTTSHTAVPAGDIMDEAADEISRLRSASRKGTMRATLNFTLPDDDYDFAAALAGRKAVAALVDIDNRCRSVLQHGSPSDETESLLREIRALIPADVLEIDQ